MRPLTQRTPDSPNSGELEPQQGPPVEKLADAALPGPKVDTGKLQPRLSWNGRVGTDHITALVENAVAEHGEFSRIAASTASPKTMGRLPKDSPFAYLQQMQKEFGPKVDPSKSTPPVRLSFKSNMNIGGFGITHSTNLVFEIITPLHVNAHDSIFKVVTALSCGLPEAEIKISPRFAPRQTIQDLLVKKSAALRGLSIEVIEKGQKRLSLNATMDERGTALIELVPLCQENLNLIPEIFEAACGIKLNSSHFDPDLMAFSDRVNLQASQSPTVIQRFEKGCNKFGIRKVANESDFAFAAALSHIFQTSFDGKAEVLGEVRSNLQKGKPSSGTPDLSAYNAEIVGAFQEAREANTIQICLGNACYSIISLDAEEVKRAELQAARIPMSHRLRNLFGSIPGLEQFKVHQPDYGKPEIASNTLQAHVPELSESNLIKVLKALSEKYPGATVIPYGSVDYSSFCDLDGNPEQTITHMSGVAVTLPNGVSIHLRCKPPQLDAEQFLSGVFPTPVQIEAALESVRTKIEAAQKALSEHQSQGDTGSDRMSLVRKEGQLEALMRKRDFYTSLLSAPPYARKAAEDGLTIITNTDSDYLQGFYDTANVTIRFPDTSSGLKVSMQHSIEQINKALQDVQQILKGFQ